MKKEKEKYLKMGNATYQKIVRKMGIRDRTFIDEKDPLENVIEDNTILIQLANKCRSNTCRVQLLEPKLQKSLKLAKYNSYGDAMLPFLCPNCGFEFEPSPVF